MPIKIPADLPACAALESENIFVMTEDRAVAQDIRPLEIVIVNLMPTKIATETQLLRLLGNSPLQVNITLLRTEAHQSKNTPAQHLERFYKTFSEIRHGSFDGMIVTGAPVEHLPFEDVDYWHELLDIMNYASSHVYSTLYICWAAQAALYHFSASPSSACPKKFLEFSATIFCCQIAASSAALTTHLPRRIPEIPKCAHKVSLKCHNCACLPSRNRPE